MTHDPCHRSVVQRADIQFSDPQTMTTNLVAQLPKYKLQDKPTFLLSCDSTGIAWLRDGFLGLNTSRSFRVGNGNPIASDGRLQMDVELVTGHDKSKIQLVRGSLFTWHVTRNDIDQIVAKLDTFLTSNIPGHQYFDLSKGSYRTVVVSKHEEPIEIVRAMRDREQN